MNNVVQYVLKILQYRYPVLPYVCGYGL